MSESRWRFDFPWEAGIFDGFPGFFGNRRLRKCAPLVAIANRYITDIGEFGQFFTLQVEVLAELPPFYSASPVIKPLGGFSRFPYGFDVQPDVP